MSSKAETKYQHYLIGVLVDMFPGCVVIKNDAKEIQGIPDLLILFHDQWAMLETKVSEKAPVQPNQPYYVALFDQMSFGAFIYPENEKGVLHDLRKAFHVARPTRVPKRKQASLA